MSLLFAYCMNRFSPDLAHMLPNNDFVLFVCIKIFFTFNIYLHLTSFGQVPVLVIFVLKWSLLKNFNLFLHL